MGEFICPVCGLTAQKSSHHILPKRHYRVSPMFYLCEQCHKELETETAKMEKLNGGTLSAPMYFNVWLIFITTKCKRGIVRFPRHKDHYYFNPYYP